MDTSSLLNRINIDFPDFDINKYEIISEWYDNHILDINWEYIFRFSKKWVNFKKEADFLIWISNKLKIDVPFPKYMPSDYSYTWYRKIKWVQLKNQILDQISKKDKDVIAFELAEFLSVIHSSRDLIQTINMQLPIYNKMEIYYNKAINKLSSTLDKDVLNFANEIIESWKNLNKVENRNQIPTQTEFIYILIFSILGIILFYWLIRKFLK